MASQIVVDDDIMNMSMDDAIPDQEPTCLPKSRNGMPPKKKSKGGSVEVKHLGVTVDMVSSLQEATWAKGAGYEVFTHSGYAKQVVAGSAYSPVPGNKIRGLKGARNR